MIGALQVILAREACHARLLLAKESAALISTKTFRRVEPNLTQESDESRIGMQGPKPARKADAMDGPGVLGHSALEPVNRFIVFA